MLRGLSILLAGALALTLALGGCGSDDSDTSSLTKAEFIKQGDAVCKKSEEDRQVAIAAYAEENPPASGGAMSKAEEEELVVAVILPPVQDQIEGLTNLGAPSGEEEQVEAIVDGLEKATEEAEADPASVLSSSSTDPFAEARELATKYGFQYCPQ